jgi:alcohol dehydrogenase class IV
MSGQLDARAAELRQATATSPKFGISLDAHLGLPAGTRLEAHLAGVMERLGLPSRLRQLGVRPEQLEDVARKAEQDTCSPTNPAPMRSRDYLQLLQDTL